MVELLNLRTARKRARRKEDDARANANRIAFGQPKAARQQAAAEESRAARELDGHRIEPEDGR
jgi:hypothetical protein